jgi:hypothetical protein
MMEMSTGSEQTHHISDTVTANITYKLRKYVSINLHKNVFNWYIPILRSRIYT